MQLWWQFFQNIVYGDLWGFDPEKLYQATLSVLYSMIVKQLCKQNYSGDNQTVERTHRNCW